MTDFPLQLKIENLESSHHGYPDWKTFTLRDQLTNGCVAVVGEVDRQFEEHTQAIANKLKTAYNSIDKLVELASWLVSWFEDEQDDFLELAWDDYGYVINVDADGNIVEEDVRELIEEYGLTKEDHIYVAIWQLEKLIDEITRDTTASSI